MKNIKRKKSNKLTFIVVAILLLIGIVTWYALSKLDQDNSEKATQKTTFSQPRADSSDDVDTTTIPMENKTPVQNEETNQTGDADSLTAQITAANQYDDVVQIRTLIEDITSSGTCTLTMTKANETFTESTGIQALPKSSTCKGFDIPTDKLSAGIWVITINIESEGKKTTLNQELTIT